MQPPGGPNRSRRPGLAGGTPDRRGDQAVDSGGPILLPEFLEQQARPRPVATGVGQPAAATGKIAGLLLQLGHPPAPSHLGFQNQCPGQQVGCTRKVAAPFMQLT